MTRETIFLIAFFAAVFTVRILMSYPTTTWTGSDARGYPRWRVLMGWVRALLAVWAWHRWARIRAGKCPQCGLDWHALHTRECDLTLSKQPELVPARRAGISQWPFVALDGRTAEERAELDKVHPGAGGGVLDKLGTPDEQRAIARDGLSRAANEIARQRRKKLKQKRGW